jgi:hypothetical protein
MINTPNDAQLSPMPKSEEPFCFTRGSIQVSHAAIVMVHVVWVVAES